MTRRTTFIAFAIVAAGLAYGGWRYTGGSLPFGLGAPADKAASAEQGGSRRRGGDGGVVAVKTATAERGDFAVRKHAIGFVETPASVLVRSRIDSQIMQQHVVDGQFVKKGDLLFTLDDRDITATIAKDEAMIAKDQATHARTLADLSRYQQLLARNAGTQQALDQATADEKSAAATILADKATLSADQLRLSYTKIMAPIDGRVGAVQVTPGNLVNASSGSGTTTSGLLTITQIKPIRVSFTMPESELALLRNALASGNPPQVKAIVTGATGPAPVGTLNFVDSSVDMTSGTIVAKAAFPNEDLSLWPGQYVDVELEAGTLSQTTIVPTVAIQAGQKGPYVYVVGKDDKVALRQVKVALAEGERSAIGEGLQPGERVVIDGQVRLKDGTRVAEAKGDGSKDGDAKQPVKSSEASTTGDRS